MKRIDPVRYARTSYSGVKKIICSDRLPYLVKFKVSSRREKEAVNEYVAEKLAQLLSLPVVPFKLIHFPKDFLRTYRSLNRYKPGPHFATLYIRNRVRKVLPPLKRNQIKNREKIAGMWVFDQWVNNTDRNRNNILLRPLSNGRYYFYMIDHGRCFPGRYKWNEKTLKETIVYKLNWITYQWSAHYIKNEQELHTFIQKINLLENKKILQVIRSIPESWDVSIKERETLYDFLVQQKKALPGVINKMIAKHQDKFYGNEAEKER